MATLQKTALNLTPQQVAALKRISKMTDIPMSRLIRQGIDLVIAKFTK